MPRNEFRGDEHIDNNLLPVFFSHPDYTVGFGISPNQPPKRVADYTAGREFQSEAALITLPRRNFLLYVAYYNSIQS